MATEMESKAQRPTANREQEPVPQHAQPPAYFMNPGQSGMAYVAPAPTSSACFQNATFATQVTALQPAQAPAVMVTQPLVVTATTSPPDTTCALIMSTISAFLCGFWCGAVGILMAWKAKIHVLDRQYEHARFSLRIVWLFFGLAILFGTAMWIGIGFYLFLLTNFYYRW